jgi:toxin ParE1/3/4
MRLIWHPLAINDRARIMDFISSDKPLAALTLDEDFEAHAERLPENPYLYKPGRIAGTREIVVHPNYIMVYRVEGDTITILRVIHAAQMWPTAD